jgi:hypothetical protein
MPYGLARTVLNSTGFLEIDKETYESLLVQSDILADALAIEQKLDLLLENFVELESEMINFSIRGMVFHDDIIVRTTTLNRRVVNLLTACRLYTDHLQHHIHGIFGEGSPEAEEVIRWKSVEFDTHFAYRFFEALRNHVQHRGFPVSGMTQHSKWVGKKPDHHKHQFRFTFGIDLDSLEEDSKFKKSTLSEAKANATVYQERKIIELKPLIRRYVESFCAIHQKTRELLKSRLELAERQIIAAKDAFQLANPQEDSVIGLSIGVFADNGVLAGEHRHLPIRLGLFRREYEAKNYNHTNMSLRYVSSE